MDQQNYKKGQVLYLKGCFTEEFFLRGLSVSQIGRELGLPSHRLANGIFISYAIKFPALHEFKLAGWAEYSTDHFVEYGKKGRVKWSEENFEKTYRGKRMPMSIEDAKKARLDGMKHHKLVKVIPNIPHRNTDEYPSGGKASQLIVVHPIQCHITNFLKGNEVFRGVWS